MASTSWLSRWSARAAGAIIAGSAVLVAAEVLLRNIFNVVVLNSFEFSTYAFAASVAFGFAYTLIERVHIRLDILYLRFPRTLRALVDAASILGMTVLAAAMAVHAWSVVATSVQLGAVSNSTLQVPLAVPQSLWAVGLSWFALVCLVMSLQVLAFLFCGQITRLTQQYGVQRNTP